MLLFYAIAILSSDRISGDYLQALMLRLLNIKISASLSGMLVVRTRYVHYGGTISKTHRVLYLLLIAMTGTELLRLGMSCIEC